MSSYDKKMQKKWNRPDSEFYLKIIVLVAVAIYTIYTLCNIAVSTYEKVTTHQIKLQNAKVINDEIQNLYDEGKKLGIVLVEQKDLENRYTIYSEEAEKIQKGVIENAHKKIAQRLVPIGTYIYLRDERQAVRVKGHTGYECLTYEGTMFLATDTDKYYTLSWQQYNALKKAEYETNN